MADVLADETAKLGRVGFNLLIELAEEREVSV